jgi:hypothetical protein
VRAPAVSQSASASSGATGAGGGSVDFTLDDDRRPTMLDITTPRSSAAWPDDEIDCGTTRCLLAEGEERNAGRITLPRAFRWNYQTFGYWVDDLSSPSRVVTAFSMGNPTPAGADISDSDATYDGRARGAYMDGDETFETDARMRARVDFRDREIDFSTSGTRIAPYGTDRFRSADDLDLSGELTIGDGFRFSGRVEAEESLEGTATGTFYGPDAQEIGGTFALDAGDETLTGAFGGRRR